MWNNLLNHGSVMWKVGHWMYEQNAVREMVAPVVNLFKPDWVMTRGHKVFIDKNDRVISLQLILNGKWEDMEIELFEKTIKPGDTVVDIGANIGLYTLAAARKAGPKGRVYAFEPDAHNFRLLVKNINANGYTNVVAVNKAVSNTNGKLKLFSSKENNFGDLRTYDTKDNRQFKEADMVSLNAYFEKKLKIDVIKIDIQGSEVKAMKGAARILKQKNMVIFTEFWPKGLNLAGNSGKEYLEQLISAGFEIFEIDSLNNKTKKIVVEKILSAYPVDSNNNADLICIKK